ncbi:MAG: hypothetical protein NVSMB25_18690 [Thermoleophilaceae bacterium]
MRVWVDRLDDALELHRAARVSACLGANGGYDSPRGEYRIGCHGATRGGKRVRGRCDPAAAAQSAMYEQRGSAGRDDEGPIAAVDVGDPAPYARSSRAAAAGGALRDEGAVVEAACAHYHVPTDGRAPPCVHGAQMTARVGHDEGMAARIVVDDHTLNRRGGSGTPREQPSSYSDSRGRRHPASYEHAVPPWVRAPGAGTD